METGEKPVRARRREVRLLPSTRGRNSGTSHWETEKARGVYRVEILSDKYYPLQNRECREREEQFNISKKEKAMKKTNFKSFIALVLCFVLIAATALFATGCKEQKKESPDTADAVTTEADTTSEDEGGKTVLGEGKTQFTFKVVDKDGNETVFEINTDKTTVGDALLELELIEGEAGDYGLYVKKVNGIVADYDADQTYWAFYINGEYAMSGVDMTEIENGAEYTFKIEK